MARFRLISYTLEKKPLFSRGFVLSFSTFALALILIITAQLQHSHLQTMQTDLVEVYQNITPARVLNDIALDFNILTGQTISFDENRTSFTFFISGKIPSPLSQQANLLRYQSNLFRLSRDSNMTVFMDLNNLIADGNLWGRTNSGLRWRESLDSNTFKIFPIDNNYTYVNIDVNIFSSLAYTEVLPQVATYPGPSLVTNSYFSFSYTDTNITHAFSIQNYYIGQDSYTWTIRYDVNGVTVDKVIRLEVYGDPNPFGFSITGPSSVPWDYSLSYNMLKDSNNLRAGYDINTTVRGKDFNVDTNTIWTYSN